MTEWIGSQCRLLTPELATTVNIACLGLALFVLGAIALGFWRWRAPLGLGASRAAASSVEFDSGLRSAWRLYRHLGRPAVDGSAAATFRADRVRHELVAREPAAEPGKPLRPRGPKAADYLHFHFSLSRTSPDR